MSGVEHTPGSGRVRLPWLAAQGLLGEASDPEAATSELVRAGALRKDGSWAPDLAPVVHAMRTADLTLEVDVATSRTLTKHRGWAGRTGGALLLDLGDGRHDLFLEPPEAFPAAVARLVRLGPRKQHPRAARDLADAVPEEVWSTDAARRTQALDALGGADPRWCWSATTSWSSADEAPAERGIVGMADPDGWWRFASGAGGPCLRPTTPTELWSLFIDLMPSDDELAVAADRP